MRTERDGQSSIEFIIILGAVVFFFSLFLLVVQGKLSDKAYEQRDIVLNDIVLAVQQEIALAGKSSDGYERAFTLPSTVLNLDYTIVLDRNWVYAITEDEKHAISLPVGNVTGVPSKGYNLIKRLGGVIYLN